jgi:hypothetical protein
VSATTGEDWPTSGTRESDRPRHRATERCLDRGSAAAEGGEGKGIGGNHKRIDSGRRTTKVSRGLERSGDPKVYALDHGGSANNWGALAIVGASRLCVLRGRERGPAGRRSTRSPRASNSPSLAEDAPANQFQSPCAGYSAGPIHFQRFRSAASGALLEGRCGERH